MYSQYSYYQNNSNASNNPQQQQPAATSTANQIWNGQQWVPTATAANNNNTAHQQQQPTSYAAVASSQQQQAPIIKHGKTHAELVQHYTSYYHNWQAQSASAKQSLSSLPPPHPATPSNNVKREEMERRDKWATYYAGNSAALAHYHLALSKNNGGGVVEPYVRPQSPPVPPQMENNTNNLVVNQVANPVTTVVPSSLSSSVGGGTVSMTLGTPKKKSRWANNTSQQQQQQQQEEQQQGDTSYYGPSSGKSINNNMSSLTNLEATAVQNRGGGNKTSSELYNKFALAGTKRKQMMSQFNNDDEEDSSSHVPNYYGPSSTTTVNNNTKTTSFIISSSKKKNSYEDDYVPLGMDQPLGSTTTTQGKLSKKERKRQKKLALANAKQQASFDSSSATTSMSGFDVNETALSERANRFKGKGGIHSASSTPSSLKGGVDKYMGKTTIGGSMKKLNDVDYERMTVKGTCTKLEKEYLRLTSPPKSELVRPQYILQEHLTNLKHSYYENNKVHNGRQRDYNWYCSQFKAIRQDLTVQRIINAFAVEVYESHAKIALEEDDINEYNQSQTQLKELYETIERNYNNGGVGGGRGGKMQKGKKRGKNKKDNEEENGLKNRNEFIAYRIIYYVFLSGNRKYEGGSSDIFKIMLQLTPEQRKDECIKHALLVRAAVADNDYHKFFQLQDIAPNMGDYLMDKIVPSIRQGALQRICKAYKPSVSLEFVLKELGFDTQNKDEVEGGKAWMESCGCKFEGDMLVTKDTIIKESASVKSSLI